MRRISQGRCWEIISEHQEIYIFSPLLFLLCVNPESMILNDNGNACFSSTLSFFFFFFSFPHFVTRTTTMENKMIYRLLMLICSLKCYCCRAVDINLLPSFLPCWLFSQLSSTFIVIRSGLILLILLIVITSTAIEMGKLFRMQLFYKVVKFWNVFEPP